MNETAGVSLNENYRERILQIVAELKDERSLCQVYTIAKKSLGYEAARREDVSHE